MTSRHRDLEVLARTTVKTARRASRPAAPAPAAGEPPTRVEVMPKTMVWTRPALPVLPVLAPSPAPVLAQGSAPAQLGLTPRIEREVFELVRRVALQADLPAAMRVLHHGLARLTDSSDAMCVFFDAALCSAWALPDGKTPCAIDDQVQQLVAQVAGTGRRAVLGRALVEPVGPAPARAVLVLRRPPTGAAYGDLDIATVAAIAAAVVALIGHFMADHVARREQEQRDARSPFRPEALAARRGVTAAPGRLVATPR
ncbi:MAG TPA: hypothetical protein VF469_21295, partial [Kofleriaceae bacterium]